MTNPMGDTRREAFSIDDKVNNPVGWWTVYRHGNPVWHFSLKTMCERFVDCVADEGMTFDEAAEAAYDVD